MLPEQHGLVPRSNVVEQVTEALRPRDRCRLRCLEEAARLHLFSEFGKEAGHSVHAAGVMHVPDEIERR